MKTDTLPRIFISVSSNIEPEKNLPEAIKRLRKHCTVKQISSVYQSPAFGYEDQPDFWDTVLEIATPMLPQMFKETVIDEIEKELGRDRANQENKYGPLTMDMDILMWGDVAFHYGKKPWRVPDANIVKYAAIAVPMAEVAPEIVHPDEKVPIKEIAARLDASKLKRVDLELE